jgi:tetratricopeptide (TPR) repeat protein
LRVYAFHSGLCAAALLATAAPAQITVDYPAAGAVFPPEFPPPTVLWRDSAPAARVWLLEAESGAARIRAVSTGPRLPLGPIDPRAVAPTNLPPALNPQQAAGHSWMPAGAEWAALQRAARGQSVTLRITGFTDKTLTRAVSRGHVAFHVSSDSVGAPVFYRDVPLMPSETEKGVIKPLATSALPLIAWRLRDTREPSSKVLLEGMHTCANCHSFSADGKTFGMDLDGPQNDKGLYALAPIAPRTTIGNEDVIAWSTFRGKLGGKLRVGFMSQVSPDGRYVATTINDPGVSESEYQRRRNLREVALNYYVANFRDYRFLQVFYPTRGILAWYSRESGRLEPLPGADDPRYVHTNAVWSPDGTYLVFARAGARDPYEPGKPMAVRANDPNETQLRYDLYRIPFNAGRGGKPEPVAGASHNGMSNSFPKISPDGRWLVFVQSRNGLLMRPDSRLFIVPASGGTPRLMNCNTPLMNSWHSFSPNGRWMVFSSKSRSAHTQMFLTHIGEDGADSPAVLIENSTAANRAVNIPEFVNISPNLWQSLLVPAADYYKVIDAGSTLMDKRRFEEAAAKWRRAIELNPAEAPPHNNLGYCLAELGRTAQAVAHYEQALSLSPDYLEALNNLGEALVKLERRDEAMDVFEKALRLNPRYASAHSNLGAVLAQSGRLDPAIEHFEQALAVNPDLADVHNNLAVALAMSKRLPEAIGHQQNAVRLTKGRDAAMLDLLANLYANAGRRAEAARTLQRAIGAATDPRMKEALRARLAALVGAGSKP